TSARSELHRFGYPWEHVGSGFESPTCRRFHVHVLVPALALDFCGVATDADRQQIAFPNRATRRRRDHVTDDEVADSVAEHRLRVAPATLAVASGYGRQRLSPFRFRPVARYAEGLGQTPFAVRRKEIGKVVAGIRASIDGPDVAVGQLSDLR